ncbi:MAG: site-specific DNA-methyltransferase [Treponema sp.]|nr:site-specific DNA-methyltransferase [Treponema sp.]
MMMNDVYHGDSIVLIKNVPDESIHLILSDIPYGIGYEEWDVLHDNTNSAYLGSSPSQEKAGAVFKKRGKPLNGWSEEDRLIAKQYYDWVMTWAPSWYRVMKPGASAFVFAGRRLAPRCIIAFEDCGFTFKDMIAWDKTRAPHRAQRISCVYERRNDFESAKKWKGWKLGNLRPIFEPILWFQKPYPIGGTLADNVLENGVGAYNEAALLKYGFSSDNIIHIGSASTDSGLHPTQKPLELMKVLIELTTIEGQTVLDPFCGSGTTLLAAKDLDRCYIGFEKEDIYYQRTKERLSNCHKDNELNFDYGEIAERLA